MLLPKDNLCVHQFVSLPFFFLRKMRYYFVFHSFQLVNCASYWSILFFFNISSLSAQTAIFWK